MFSKLDVGKRLILSALLSILVLVVIVTSATIIFSKINKGVESIYEDRVVPLRDLKIIADNYAVLVIDAVNKANAGRKSAAQALDNIRQARSEIAVKWKQYMATNLTATEVTLAHEANALFVTANTALDQVEITLAQVSGNAQGQLDEIDGPLYEKIDPISDKLAGLIDLQLEIAEAEHHRIEAITKILTLAFILAAFIAIILLITLGFITHKSIISPLKQLKNTMQNIEKTSDLSLVVEVNSKDEIGETALAFNKMMARLKELVIQVKQASILLNYASGNMSKMVEQSSASTRQQQQDTDQVSTAVIEMSDKIQELANNTNDAQLAAQKADTLTNDGRNIAGRSTELIKDLMSEIQTTSEQIQTLENESQNIGSVVDVINSIAEQTNLLALNAAIEAARAGEQGRGFAVVADEVRNLAQRTQKSTQEIRDVVERLQLGSHNVVMAMEVGNQKTEACNETVQKVQEYLANIKLSVQSIHDMNTNIATALQEQMTVTNEIKTNVSSINHLANEGLQVNEKVSNSSQSLVELAVQMENQVDSFNVEG